MNKKNTIQRKLVLDAVRELGCHSTAEDVFRRVSSVHPSVSKGTVYRNLNSLTEDGEIYRVEIPGEADRFDHVCQKHYHVICVKCGRVFDVDMDPVPSLTDRIRDTQGFDFLECDIVFKGVCPLCKSKTQTEQNEAPR